MAPPFDVAACGGGDPRPPPERREREGVRAPEPPRIEMVAACHVLRTSRGLQAGFGFAPTRVGLAETAASASHPVCRVPGSPSRAGQMCGLAVWVWVHRSRAIGENG
jgi:hypothetical protein